LTNDAKKVFAVIYREYERRRSAKISKDDAICFDDCQFVKEKLVQMIPEDVDSAVEELNRLELISQNVDDSFELTDKAIEYKENLPLATAKEITDIISKFIP
jgi:hypothetical protein